MANSTNATQRSHGDYCQSLDRHLVWSMLLSCSQAAPQRAQPRSLQSSATELGAEAQLTLCSGLRLRLKFRPAMPTSWLHYFLGANKMKIGATYPLTSGHLAELGFDEEIGVYLSA